MTRPRRQPRGAVFLDKDGTLIEDLPYNVDPSRIRLAPGALRALAALAKQGWPLVIISNQPGVALGLFPEEALLPVVRWLRSTLHEYGIPLAGFYYCPHHPAGTVLRYALDCDCRKPEPGLLLRAAADLHIDLERSWFVGDILNDVEAGRRAGCRTILLDNGNETEWRRSPLREPHFVARSLPEAAEHILAAAVIAEDQALALAPAP